MEKALASLTQDYESGPQIHVRVTTLVNPTSVPSQEPVFGALRNSLPKDDLNLRCCSDEPFNVGGPTFSRPTCQESVQATSGTNENLKSWHCFRRAWLNVDLNTQGEHSTHRNANACRKFISPWHTSDNTVLHWSSEVLIEW
jgi:hypothetical protein